MCILELRYLPIYRLLSFLKLEGLCPDVFATFPADGGVRWR